MKGTADQVGIRRAIAAGDPRSSAALADAFRVPISTVRRLRREAAAATQGKLFE